MKTVLEAPALPLACEALRAQGGVWLSHAGRRRAVFSAEMLAPEQWQALAQQAENLALALPGGQHYDARGLTHSQFSHWLEQDLGQQPPPAPPLNGDEELAQAAGHALALAQRARLLPLVLLAESTQESWRAQPFPQLSSAQLAPHAPRLQAVTQAALPLAGAEHSRIFSFRDIEEGSEHLALLVGAPALDQAPLVRLHSSCVTGDLLGSLRCDCGDQLRQAIARMVQEGGGVLLYLHQEGRGIGLANKLRAYRLQERGLDTYRANRALGFAEDARDYALAAALLKHLGVARLRLLTNNPRKLDGLKAHGLEVVERVALLGQHGAHNQHYLAAKRAAGHQLDG